MRKQELVHLHGLLGEVWRHCEREGELSIDLSRYASLETAETSIYRDKDDHRDAVFALADAITDGFGNERTAVASTNAD